MLEDLAFLDAKLVNVKKKIDEFTEADTLSANETKILKAYSGKLDEMHKSLVAKKMSGITGEEQLREKMSNVYGALMRYSGKPTQSQIDRLVVLEKEMSAKELQAGVLLNSELAIVNSLLVQSKI